MKTKFFSYLILIIIVIGMNSCSKSNSYMPATTTTNTTASTTTGSTSASQGANEVLMQNTSFVPATKTIAVGTTITWTNKDAETHDVASSTGLFKSPSMGQNATFSYTFNTAGTYNYSCVFHSGMNGTIIVQ
jgi:plastocyanin